MEKDLIAKSAEAQSFLGDGVEAANVVQSAGAGVSMWALFAGATFLVQLIMLALFMASFWTWAVLFAKYTQLRVMKLASDKFERAFWSGGSLDSLFERVRARPQDPLGAVFCSGMQEWKRSTSKGASLDGEKRASLLERVDTAMVLSMQKEEQKLMRQLQYLSIIGSSAPYVGLFGTVWGIMHSFQSIAASKNASLAVVAPGLAEALLATALGLVAAIPAMAGYNKMVAAVEDYMTRIQVFSGEFHCLVSRQMDEGQ